jgi:drug/metabolite transporter (DMT)-like permease
MSFSVDLGLVLALLTAFGSVAGFLYKFRGAREAPSVELAHPWRSTVDLFRSPLYTLGILIALGSWGFHVGALALAPISLVQSVIAGGLVLLTVVADKLFGIEVTRREWIGVGLTAAGLAFLAATLDGDAGSAHSHYDPATLAVFLAAVGAAGCLLAFAPRRPALLAVSAGLLWATSDTSIKALSSHLGDLGAGVLLHPLALVILVASLVGLLISARRLQLGDAVPMIALTSAAANLTTIAAGPLVFGEPMPDTRLGVVVRVLAFACVIVAAALTPPPAADQTPRPS